MTWKRLITKAHPCMSDSSQSWEPGAQGTDSRQLNRLEGVPQLV